MGKHSRPGPPNQPSRAIQSVDPDDPLAPYYERREPPLSVYRRQRPLLQGGASHVRPEEPRSLEEWNGFVYEPAGTASDLAAAQRWVSEATPES